MLSRRCAKIAQIPATQRVDVSEVGRRVAEVIAECLSEAKVQT